MKRLAGTILALTMVLGLCACSSVPAASGSDPAPSAQQDMYIGISFPTLSTEFYSEIADRVEAIAGEQGIKVEITSCELDSNQQMQQIENFATMGITHLIIQSYDMESMVDALLRARQGGMYVASFGVSPSNLDSVDIIPGCIDSRELGALCAENAAKWIDNTFPDAADGSIEVGVITNTSTADTTLRSEGLLSVGDYTSKATVVGSYDLIGVSDSGTKAQEYIDIMMEEHPDIKCVIIYDSIASIGANEAAMRNARVDAAQFGIFGCDFTSTMGDLIAQSAENASVLRGAVKTGDDMAQMLFDAVTGGLNDQIDPETKAYLMPLHPIDIDNLSDYTE